MAVQSSSDIVVNGMVVASLLFWGAWGIFDKKALSYTSPIGQLTAVYTFSPILAVVLACVLNCLEPGWTITSHTFYYEALGSLAYFVADLGYLMALVRGDASLIIGVTASYPVVAQLLANVMLGEQLVPARIIGCAVVVAGIIALSGNNGKFGDITDSARKSERSDMLITIGGVVLAVVGWAYRGIFDKIAVDGVGAGPLEVNLAKYVCDTAFGVLALGWVWYKRNEISFFKAKGLWPCAAGSAICLAGGSAAYFIALSRVSASYVIAITGCYPVIMYVLALLILKEKFNLSRAIGITLITVGGILTQTTQNC